MRLHMICLIDTEDIPDAGIIKRFIRFLRGYRGIATAPVTILGLRALYLRIQVNPTISQRAIEKRIKNACRAMIEKQVSMVLFSKNFPYKPNLLREGFDEMESSLLFETLAGKIATDFAGDGKCAVLFAKRLTGSALAVLDDLCAGFRYVMVESESDGGGIVSSLGRRFGISVIMHPTALQLLNADAAVFFDPPGRKSILPDRCLTVAVTKPALTGVVFREAVTGLMIELTGGKTMNIPDSFPIEPLLAVALYAGTIGREDMILRGVLTTVRVITKAQDKAVNAGVS